MAEQTTIKIPMEITPPAQRQEQPRPEWARKSLHAVKMPRREVELAPEWVNNGPNVEVKWQPVEQSAPSENTSSQSQPYQQQGVNYMEQNQSGNDQQPQGGAVQPPDPTQYDFYDPTETVRFHQDNAAYYQQVVDARVQAHLAPHMGAFQEAQLQRDYNAAVARYGQDENFQQCMEVALENCAEAAKNGKPFDIVKEYQNANDQSAARPGKRGSAHLPEQFRDKKRGIGMLGRIMHHNQQTGRAKPFGGRNWKG